MKKKSTDTPLFFTSLVLLIFIIVITFIACPKSFRDNVFHPDYIDFSNGWVNENNETVELNKISQSCTLHKVIPEMDSDEVLSFNARNLDVNVFIDDNCVYKYKKPSDKFLTYLYGKTTGSDFVEVPIYRENAGRTLYLYINNPYKSGNDCKIVNMFLGDGVAIVKHEASVQLGAFCFSVILLFVGIVCLLLYVPLHHHKMIDNSILYLGMAAFSLGMSTLCDSKMLHLLVGHETLYYTISQLFMIVIPVPLLLFFDKLYGGVNHIIVSIICGLCTIDLFLVIIINGFGFSDYHDNIFIVLINFAITIAYIGFITISQMVKQEKINLYHNIGICMLTVTIILDFLVTRNSVYLETSFFTRFGISGFMSMECIQILWKHMENYQRGIKAQMISRLAYRDGLTDLLNRTSFMEDMEALEKENPRNCLIGMFDINSLKYVNDNFGHLCGDELIIHIAGAIQEIFSPYGKCYRIGGDEFVFISTKENAEDDFLQGKYKLRDLVMEFDQKSEFPASVALGYAVKNEETKSLNDLLNMADEKMYANKKKMKA